jgi:hypothetical protein
MEQLKAAKQGMQIRQKQIKTEIRDARKKWRPP